MNVSSSKSSSRKGAVRGLTHELGEGRFIIDLVPEQGRRNVNRLTIEAWDPKSGTSEFKATAVRIEAT